MEGGALAHKRIEEASAEHPLILEANVDFNFENIVSGEENQHALTTWSPALI